MGLHEATNQLKQMAIIRGVFRLLAGSGSAYTPVLFLHALLLGLPFRCSTWKPAGTMYSWIKGTEESYTSQSIEVFFLNLMIILVRGRSQTTFTSAMIFQWF